LGKNRTAPLQQAKLVTFNFQGVKASKKIKKAKHSKPQATHKNHCTKPNQVRKNAAVKWKY
jgi:hypothetical protein